jgi:hypothetical protein
VALSSGAVLFFENFHVHLVWLHRTCGNELSGQGRFSAAHASAHVLMVGASLTNGFATWRSAMAQSGCLTFGSLLANQRRQSAICQGLVNCPSCGGQCGCSRWQANAQRTSRSRGYRHLWLALEVVYFTLASIEAVSIMVCRHRPKPWHHRVLAIWPSIGQNV